jgi:phosphoribosylformylglycinamidine synthase subunit PurQ / glutaminase
LSARFGVVVFPGTNCEHDVVKALEEVSRSGGAAAEVELVWHGETSLSHLDAVVIPGGFAHGDYLRPGAIARFSPVMESLSRFAADGGPVVGICNGFQVLTESGLLPGALQKNSGLRFLCKRVEVTVVSTRSVLTTGLKEGTRLHLPINHFEGNYTCDPETLARLRDEDRVVLRYKANPNGSVDSIAGVTNSGGNVVGLMPHPERACDPLTGELDGVALLSSLLSSTSRGAPAAPPRAGRPAPRGSREPVARAVTS